MAIEAQRILAFFLCSFSPSSELRYLNAKRHLQKLAALSNNRAVEIRFGRFCLLLCLHGDEKLLVKEISGSIHFYVGPMMPQIDGWNKAEEGDRRSDRVRDRFLHVCLEHDGVVVETDYAATIPCFYSVRDGLWLSNLEPLVVLATQLSDMDIDPCAVALLMRYGHLMWESTVFRHIRMQQPDSLCRWTETENRWSVAQKSLNSITINPSRCNRSDREVADEFYQLNRELVCNALRPYEMILLPLSSGYDSRLVLAGADERIRERMRTFTYGLKGSIERCSAKTLSDEFDVIWKPVDMPCLFLEPAYTKLIAAIFGCALHFHGMYQLEFAEIVTESFSGAVFTSGFMTGVPAGQHVSKMTKSKPQDLCGIIDVFSQSKYWTIDALLESGFAREAVTGGMALAEEELRKTAQRIDADPVRQSILIDVWTRQRGFISYHPRTLEWLAPIVSPHMCPEYVNFFLSLSDTHLKDRRAIELMLADHYPRAWSVPSNSQGVRTVQDLVSNFFDLTRSIVSRSSVGLALCRLTGHMPSLDAQACVNVKESAFWPILNQDGSILEGLDQFVSPMVLRQLVRMAMSGDEVSYNRLAMLQPIALAVSLCRNNATWL